MDETSNPSERSDNANAEEVLPVTDLTWAALLGHWVDFARSALALAADGDDGLMRASVPDIIALQATWFALGDLTALAGDEQALGLDRAGELIRRHGAALEARWAGSASVSGMPKGILELIQDAKLRLEEQRNACQDAFGSRLDDVAADGSDSGPDRRPDPNSGSETALD